jgi:hypothetical protein
MTDKLRPNRRRPVSAQPPALSREGLAAERESISVPDGEHEVRLAKATKSHKPSGEYLNLTFATAEGQTFVDSYLTQPSPKRPDLLELSISRKEMLLEFLEAALGVSEVASLPAALKEAMGKPVMCETRRKRDRGQTRTTVGAFWPVPEQVEE